MTGPAFTPQPDRLTVCVFGPGFGESIVVVLPDAQSFIVVDGASPAASPPAVGFVESLWTPKSSLELLLLTHPHADHYAGIDTLLNHPKVKDGIVRVGCVCEYLAAEGTLSAELRASFSAIDVDDPEARRELGRVRAVLERIGDEWIEHPGRAFSAVDGRQFSVQGVDACVLGPTREEVRAFFVAPDLTARILGAANDLSVVLQLRYGDTVVLLGGDLPHTRRGRVVASGWQSVTGRHANLNLHRAYKIAHHASREAIHPSLVTSEGSGARSWIVTPYNKGERLPDFGVNGGVASLHGSEDRIALTGLPVGIRAQRTMPDSARRSEFEEDTVAVSGLAGLPTIRSGRSGVPPEECYWVFEFDAHGAEVGRHRGAGATMVLAG